jgi:hypothetical protein
MSNFQRREFLTGAAAIAAATTATLVGTRRADAGDPSFMNNVPDPLLSGKDLPTFKFALEKSNDLSQWIAGNPTDVLATNFGEPTSVFEKFPHRDVFIVDKDGRHGSSGGDSSG